MKGHLEKDLELFLKCQNLSGSQKDDLLEYLEKMPRRIHNTRLYRRKALKQIREALNNQT